MGDRVLTFAEAAERVGMLSRNGNDRGSRLRRAVRRFERESGKRISCRLGDGGKRRGVKLSTLRRYMPELFNGPSEIIREIRPYIEPLIAKAEANSDRIDEIEAVVARLGERFRQLGG